MVHRYPPYIISTRPIEMVWGGLHHEFYLYILIFPHNHQNNSPNPFFFLSKGKCWQSSIITVAFSAGCPPCEIVTSSDETQCICNYVLLQDYTNGNFLLQALSTKWGIFLLNHNSQYDSLICHDKQI